MGAASGGPHSQSKKVPPLPQGEMGDGPGRLPKIVTPLLESVIIFFSPGGPTNQGGPRARSVQLVGAEAEPGSGPGHGRQ